MALGRAPGAPRCASASSALAARGSPAEMGKGGPFPKPLPR